MLGKLIKLLYQSKISRKNMYNLYWWKRLQYFEELGNSWSPKEAVSHFIWQLLAFYTHFSPKIKANCNHLVRYYEDDEMRSFFQLQMCVLFKKRLLYALLLTPELNMTHFEKLCYTCYWMDKKKIPFCTGITWQILLTIVWEYCRQMNWEKPICIIFYYNYYCCFTNCTQRTSYIYSTE